MKTKRRIYEVRPGATEGWYLVLRGNREEEFLAFSKKAAVTKARYIVRRNAPSQLLVYTLSGRIEKGGSGEASYAADSPRRPG